MSNFERKYNFKAKGVLYVKDGVICVENPETGELVEIAEHLADFNGKEATLQVSYGEEVE